MHKGVQKLLIEKGMEAWTVSVEGLSLTVLGGSKSHSCFNLGCLVQHNVPHFYVGNWAAKSRAPGGRRGTRCREVMSGRLPFFARINICRLAQKKKEQQFHSVMSNVPRWWGREEDVGNLGIDLNCISSFVCGGKKHYCRKKQWEMISSLLLILSSTVD